MCRSLPRRPNSTPRAWSTVKDPLMFPLPKITSGVTSWSKLSAWALGVANANVAASAAAQITSLFNVGFLRARTPVTTY